MSHQQMHIEYISSLYSISLNQVGIPNDVWWRKHYFPSSNQKLMDEIKKFKNSILNETIDEFFDDYSNFYRYKYIQECLVEERNINATGLPAFELFDHIEETISDLKHNKATVLDKSSIKIINMYLATLDLFPQVFFPQLEMDNFTPELAKSLHKTVCKNILNNNGEYRTSCASPAQENFEYLSPDYIEDAMEILFNRIRKLLDNHNDLESKVKISALFLSNFLFIHPFSNGNGRVARLLMSYILSSESVVPVSLLIQCQQNECRPAYMDCLREAQKTIPLKPDALSTFVLESIHNTLRNACISMDISLDNN